MSTTPAAKTARKATRSCHSRGHLPDGTLHTGPPRMGSHVSAAPPQLAQEIRGRRLPCPLVEATASAPWHRDACHQLETAASITPAPFAVRKRQGQISPKTSHHRRRNGQTMPSVGQHAQTEDGSNYLRLIRYHWRTVAYTSFPSKHKTVANRWTTSILRRRASSMS
jgi:hypothetical protein